MSGKMYVETMAFIKQDLATSESPLGECEVRIYLNA